MLQKFSSSPAKVPYFSMVSLCLFAVVSLSACFPGVYKLDIPQGNILEKEKIDQLKIGMNKRQVRYLLGTPLVMDSFNQDRWDYYYSHRYYLPHHSEAILRKARLVLTFEKNQLVTIDRQIPEDFFPPDSVTAPASPVTPPLPPEPELPEPDSEAQVK